MKINYLTPIIILQVMMLISGCNQSEKNASVGLPYQINWSDFLYNPREISKLSSIANSINYIKLKTPDSVKLGFMYEINFNRDNLYILDVTFSLYVFDMDGNLKNIINHRGRGPGEYTGLSGFTIDEDNNLLAFHLGPKVWFYDFLGKFIKEIQIEGEEYPISIKWIGNGMFLGMMRLSSESETDNNPVSTIVFNSDGKIVRNYKYYIDERKSESQNVMPSPASTLLKVTDGVLVKGPYNDTVFIINKELESSPYLINNLGAYRPPRAYFENPENYNFVNNSVSLKSTGYIIYNKTYLFSGNSYITFKYNNQDYLGIWDFGKKTAFSIPSSTSGKGLKDDIDFGLPFVSPHTGTVSYNNPDELIDIIEPVKLLQDKSLKPREGSQLAEIMEDMKIEDNSVIRILNTKTKIKQE